MKAMLLGAAVAALAVAAPPLSAHADDYAASIQQQIDDLTDQRNAYLAESAFGKSYSTPVEAAAETVNSAIELYRATMAEPRVPITQRGTFVTHPANPYGTTVVAFEVINSMESSEEIYPFVVDVGTLEVLAEGAFPGTVGLSAAFLNDADRPLEVILEDLQESDGTWASYVFNNPRTGNYDLKYAWLSLYDGYIFGSGYYREHQDDNWERVASMLRMYEIYGEDSFAAMPSDSGVSFVLDRETLEIVAHTKPSVSGDAIKHAIGAAWHLGHLSDILAEHGTLRVSYPSPDPQPGSEYILAHIHAHDGYVFGSGYEATAESRIQSLASEAVQLYDLYGEDAFGTITAMEGTGWIVLNPADNTVLAFAGWPDLVGMRLGANFFDQDREAVLESLENSPGLWTDSIFANPLATDAQETRSTSWMTLRDGYIFIAAEVYSPEEASVAAVDAAIALYAEYGEEAFDRITWKSVRPEIVYPFVVDARTWELVAHASVPERVGSCCAAPIAASNDLDLVRKDLESGPGTWLEYTFYNPVSGMSEYKRVWLSTYDGYTFAAGYYYGSFDRMERMIRDVVDVYEAEGWDAALASVNAMAAGGPEYPFVLDRETLEIVAHGQDPRLVGTGFGDKALDEFLPVSKIEADLRDDGDTTFAYYSVADPATGAIQTRTVLFQLHDGYVVAAGQPFVVYTR